MEEGTKEEGTGSSRQSLASLLVSQKALDRALRRIQ